MFMVNNKTVKLPSKLKRENYLKEINSVDLLNRNTQKINKLIDICFGIDILGNNTIRNKIPITLMYALCLALNKTHSTKMNKVNEKDKKILLSTVRKLQRAMIGVTKEGVPIKKEIFKTVELLTKKFGEIRKDIINENSPISSDDDIDSDSETSEEYSEED